MGINKIESGVSVLEVDLMETVRLQDKALSEVAARLPDSTTPIQKTHEIPQYLSPEIEAYQFISGLLTNCENEVRVIKPQKDVGLGLSFTEILQLVNVVISEGSTPVIDPTHAIWFSGSSVTIRDTLNIPCSIKEDDNAYDHPLRCTGICPPGDTFRRTWVPPEFLYLGYFWWYKQLARAVIRPSEKLLRSLHQSNPLHNSSIRASEFSHRDDYNVYDSPFSSIFNLDNLERPIISLHLRQGDSCVNTRPKCIQSAELIYETLIKHGLTNGTLLIATDSQGLLDDMYAEKQHYNFGAIVSLGVDRSLYEKLYDKKVVPIEDLKSLHTEIHSTDIVLEAVLDIALLSLGDHHVGSFYSNFIRIGLSLSPQKIDHEIPKYVSFDAEFCPFESCHLGWLSKKYCPRWHKHLCQWRNKNYCANEDLPAFKVSNCGILAGSSCSTDCYLFALSKRAFKLISKGSSAFNIPSRPNRTILKNNRFLWRDLENKLVDNEYISINTVRNKLLHSKDKFWVDQVALLTYPFYFASSSTLIEVFVTNTGLCHRKKRQESFYAFDRQGSFGSHCLQVRKKLESVSRYLRNYVYEDKIQLLLKNINVYIRNSEKESNPYILEKAPNCDKRFFDRAEYDSDFLLNRATFNVFESYSSEQTEHLFNAVPAQDCTYKRQVPNFETFFRKKRKSSGAIVYLAQKKHSSYKSDSLGRLKKSLSLLYKHFNNNYRYDVLIFHSGDFDEEQDIHDLRLISGLSRPEVHLIELKGKFWEVPGFINLDNSHHWEDDQFSVGYRNMCRWYSGLLFEFVYNMGYEYVMRMDEDSYLLSTIDYDIFDFMKRNNYEYGFRQDAIEPCCDLNFRKKTINKLVHKFERLTEIGSYFSIGKKLSGNSSFNGFYGFYNNFFITRVDFWLRPHVRKLFNFIDWTGAFYIHRENDLFVQSLTVQLFMESHKIKKFTDFSYQHVTGFEKGRCEWGALSIGYPPYSNKNIDSDVKYHVQKLQDFKQDLIVHNLPDGKLGAIYCKDTNFVADVKLNIFGVGSTFDKGISTREDFVYIEQNTDNVLSDGYNKLLARAFTSTDITDQGKFIYLEPAECGVGCGLNFMVKPILYALGKNFKVVTPKSLWLRGELPDNCSRDLSCLLGNFSPLSNSSLLKPSHSGSIDLKTKFSQDDVEFFEQFSSAAENQMLLKEFDGLFWQVSHIIKYILTPSRYLQERIQRVVNHVGLNDPSNKPVLGIHVRMGDSCSDPKKFEKGRSCDTLDTYLPHIRDMVLNFGFKSVYVATDSESTIKRILQEKPFGLNWMYNAEQDRKKYNVFIEASAQDELSIEGVLFGNKKIKSAGFDAFSEITDFLIDTIILGDYTDGLVGKFTSNMDRLVANLYSTKKDLYFPSTPVISLDAEWCFDFMVNSGKTYDGRLFYC